MTTSGCSETSAGEGRQVGEGNIRQRIEEVAAFSPIRQPVRDYLQKPRGSPFENLTVPSVDRFLVRHQKNFFRRFPVWKEK